MNINFQISQTLNPKPKTQFNGLWDEVLLHPLGLLGLRGSRTFGFAGFGFGV